jgi:trk system potassium uptake protein TrkA
MRVIIAGGGKVAYFLARNFLAKGHTVVSVSDNLADCRWLARRLKATVVHGDGSDPAVLEEAGAHEADAVLAATQSDQDNLVICQIAEARFHVPTTLAVVNDPDNRTVFPRLGVKNVVCITELASNLIEELATADEITNLTVMAGGAVNVAELVVRDTSPVLGRPLAEASLPPDVLIAGVVRDGCATIAHGDTVLVAGDRIVLVTLPRSHGRAVRLLTGED